METERRWEAPSEASELVLHILGEDLSIVRFGDRETDAGRSRIFLGIQKGQEVVDRVPVAATQTGPATFTAILRVSPLPGGETNFLGPYAHGTRTARFCYLCWLEEEGDSTVTVFSRIKLPLNSLRWSRVEAAARTETPIVMRFSLVGKKGGPTCASIPEDDIRWESSLDQPGI